jgi:hypothetical protein
MSLAAGFAAVPSPTAARHARSPTEAATAAAAAGPWLGEVPEEVLHNILSHLGGVGGSGGDSGSGGSGSTCGGEFPATAVTNASPTAAAAGVDRSQGTSNFRPVHQSRTSSPNYDVLYVLH